MFGLLVRHEQLQVWHLRESLVQSCDRGLTLASNLLIVHSQLALLRATSGCLNQLGVRMGRFGGRVRSSDSRLAALFARRLVLGLHEVGVVIVQSLVSCVIVSVVLCQKCVEVSLCSDLAAGHRVT